MCKFSTKCIALTGKTTPELFKSQMASSKKMLDSIENPC